MFDSQQDQAETACTDCAVQNGDCHCHVLLGKLGQDPRARLGRPRGAHQTAHAGELIYRSGEPVDAVPILCDGWAFAFVMLFDGRRQILSFLLPGDVMAVTALLTERLSFSIQALTELHYCRFSKSELRSRMVAEPKFLDRCATIWAGEKEQSDQLVTDLGRRTADERIARLLLSLMTRLSDRGMVHDQSFAFPLRQRHIADATGLTPVHVSRVIGGFRNAGLIDISGRWLKIRNLSELRRIGDVR